MASASVRSCGTDPHPVTKGDSITWTASVTADGADVTVYAERVDWKVNGVIVATKFNVRLNTTAIRNLETGRTAPGESETVHYNTWQEVKNQFGLGDFGINVDFTNVHL